jgi:hypothetical protein
VILVRFSFHDQPALFGSKEGLADINAKHNGVLLSEAALLKPAGEMSRRVAQG